MALKTSNYNVWTSVDGVGFVYNGRVGSLTRTDDLTEQHIDAFVRDRTLPPGGAASLEELVRAGVLISPETDELATLRDRYLAARYSRRLGLTLITSLGCNFDCPYCYEEKEPGLMGPETQAQLLALVDDSLPHIESVSITWLGGEPLLGKRAIYDLSDAIIARCDAAGVDYNATIITNGWHLDRETALALAERRVGFAQVTIDGPPEFHNRYRPRIGGGATFDRIVDNLVAMHDVLPVLIRVNVDRGNFGEVDRLLELLAERGLADGTSIEPARIAGITENPLAPAASYAGNCFTPEEFADAEREFASLARSFGFRTRVDRQLPSPIGTPCTAVSATSLVVGPNGELWKCWDEVGDEAAVFGHLSKYGEHNNTAVPWLDYVPADDPVCASCIALPVCQGGCVYNGRAGKREDQCGTFRLNHHERVTEAARASLGLAPFEPTELPLTQACKTAANTVPTAVATPVTLTRR